VKISIDSTEPLQDVLRVIGAAYEVTLAVAQEGGRSVPPLVEASSRAGSSRRVRGRGTSGRPSAGRTKSTGGPAKVSSAELRSWARQNGYAVRDRGRVPAAVVAAHHKAN